MAIKIISLLYLALVSSILLVSQHFDRHARLPHNLRRTSARMMAKQARRSDKPCGSQWSWRVGKISGNIRFHNVRPRSDVSWLTKAPVTRVISTINHSYWSYKPTWLFWGPHIVTHKTHHVPRAFFHPSLRRHADGEESHASGLPEGRHASGDGVSTLWSLRFLPGATVRRLSAAAAKMRDFIFRNDGSLLWLKSRRGPWRERERGHENEMMGK